MDNQDRKTVAQRRKYGVLTTSDAKRIAIEQLKMWKLETSVEFGLPEVDDRYHVWRVPLLSLASARRVGELVINAKTSEIDNRRSTKPNVLSTRLGMPAEKASPKKRGPRSIRDISRSQDLRNVLALGNSEELLRDFPSECVQLVFTSPPYYNARPDYSDYVTYEEYLLQIRKVIQQCHRLLADGRFFVMNIAPVLLRREERSKSSRRIAVPFDVHRIFIEEGFDFIDDIIWQKPEGAGWATSRGRRFAADRNPLQYKAVPVTEYLLVYRKQSTKLIDHHIRELAGTDKLQKSKILGDYDKTNIWNISPASSPYHPAIFPLELALKVLRYYSFVGDTVLDPYAGTGTVGEAAVRMDRRFMLVDNSPEYVDLMRKRVKSWLGRSASAVLCVNCAPIEVEEMLL